MKKRNEGDKKRQRISYESFDLLDVDQCSLLEKLQVRFEVDFNDVVEQ